MSYNTRTKEKVMANSRTDFLDSFRDDFLSPLEKTFNKFYDEFIAERQFPNVLKSSGGYPHLDVLSEGDKWMIEIACPGLKAEDVEVEIVPGKETRFLQISGKMSDEHSHSDGAKYHVQELHRSSFKRLIKLPANIKKEPDAVMKDGMLKLTWIISEITPERQVILVKSQG